MTEELTVQEKSTAEMAKIAYIMYLVAIVFGITGIVGVVMAYINKDDAPDWLKTHYQFIIRTFWIGGLYLFIGTILSFVLIGVFVIFFWIIWLIIRCVKGMKYLERNEAHPNPTGWMF